MNAKQRQDANKALDMLAADFRSIGAEVTVNHLKDTRTILEDKALSDLEAGKPISDHRCNQAIRAIERRVGHSI